MFILATTEAHIARIESLAKEIWTEHYTPMIGMAQVEYMLEKFQSAHAIAAQIKSGLLYYLIQESGHFIGYIGVQPKEDELFLSKLYVQASSRNKGYGKRAVQHVESLARENGLGKISLTVNKNNITSIKAYETFGFKTVAAIVQGIGNGFVMDDYRMEKPVSLPHR